MRKPESCKIEYCGYIRPQEPEEINFEILGLKNLIKIAEQRISELEQSAFLADLAIKNNIDTIDKLFSNKEDYDKDCKG